jgi:hypothetical protein
MSDRDTLPWPCEDNALDETIDETPQDIGEMPTLRWHRTPEGIEAAPATLRWAPGGEGALVTGGASR